MKVLDLILKHKWYDMIASGIKKEEYRDFKEFYIKRLVKETHPDTDHLIYKEYDVVRFHRGYTNTTMFVECKGIRLGNGNPDWGAEKGVKYFVIELGEICKNIL